MTHRILAFAAVLALPFLAAADEPAKPTHVVELFTSQGCSSCPPANRFVGKIAEEESTLVLSYGVTYWDYLGWKDTFGDKRFTQRQRDYRDAFGAANIYTPQIVLGGAAHSPRYSKKDVIGMPLTGEGVGLRATRVGENICFSSDARSSVQADIVTYQPGEQSVKVRRGENGGRTLSLTNVVTDVAPWTATDEHCLKAAPGLAYAALIHDGETAKILDAVVVD
jgi:hypothetical protein